jgi:hypothetical protein
MSHIPQTFRVRQNFPATVVENIPATVNAELTGLDLGKRVKPGQSVAVTCGSRGIANIAVIIKACIDHLKLLGAKPFIVPAMGSHAGGTAEGQKALIADYGVTEEAMGCPIKATMETVIVCEAAEGFPVHFDKNAFGADHVLVVGRIKPHTMFAGEVESGLMKMMLIGLGKHNGAIIYHQVIKNYSFAQIIRSVAKEVLDKCRILAGLGIVENAYDQTGLIKAVGSHEFEARESELLSIAKEWLPRLPFKLADVLLVDEIGKNLSGTGMDTNVIGRKYNDHEPRDFEFPKVKRIIVRDLTEETHGNASGIGIAEFCRSRVVEKTDNHNTWVNCLTAGHVTACMVPIHFPTDYELVDKAIPTVGLVTAETSKLIWIHNTLELSEVECSTAYWNEAQSRSDLTILKEPRPLPFDKEGNLPDNLFKANW